MASIQEVLKAVDDPDWQAFRLSLKGLDTRVKLDRLQERWESGDKSRAEEVRIDNYIKALCRGGQLWAGETLTTMLVSKWHPKIRRQR